MSVSDQTHNALQAEYKMINEAYHRQSNEFAVLLSQKEESFRDKCVKCRGSRLI